MRTRSSTHIPPGLIPPRRATCLRVGIGQQRTFSGEPVDVGPPGAHDAPVVRADIQPTDVFSQDQQDVGRSLAWVASFIPIG